MDFWCTQTGAGGLIEESPRPRGTNLLSQPISTTYVMELHTIVTLNKVVVFCLFMKREGRDEEGECIPISCLLHVLLSFYYMNTRTDRTSGM